MNKAWLHIITGIMIVLIFSACHKYYSEEGFPCDYCYTEKQTEGLLTILLTMNSQNPMVPIMIFEDKLDYRDTIWVDTTNESSYDIFVPIDKYYSVTAEYKSGSKTIIAVDGDRVYMRKNTTDCETDCWIVFDGEVDLRLKDDY